MAANEDPRAIESGKKKRKRKKEKILARKEMVSQEKVGNIVVTLEKFTYLL